MNEPAALATIGQDTDDATIKLPSLPGPAAKGFDMVPTTFAEAKEFAEFLSTSRIVPKEFHKQPADIFVAVQMGLDLNLRPMQALQNIAVINGKPVMYGDGVLAVVRGSGLLEFITEEMDGDTAICTVKRKGEDSLTRGFSMEDAQRAELTKKGGPWKQYPRRMLQMRARSWALRDGFADVLKGITVREEAEDHARVIQHGEDAQTSGAAAINERLKPKAKAPESKAEQEADAPVPLVGAPTFDDLNLAIERAQNSDDLDAAADQFRDADITDDERDALVFYGKKRRAQFEREADA